MFSPHKTLYTYFPLQFFLRVTFLVLVFVAAVIVVHKLYKKEKLNKSVSAVALLLVLYVLLVLFYTVLGRRTQVGYYNVNFDIVGSYTTLFLYKNAETVKETLLNVVMFIPVGVGVYFIAQKYRVLHAAVFGVVLSAFIEVLQFVLSNGYSELTDIVHNTLGAVAGALVALFAASVYKNIKRRKASKDGDNE